VAQLKASHKQRGFQNIGYHFYVQRDGTLIQTRSLQRVGAHVYRHNRNSIGICYEGGLDTLGHPKDTRTPAQKATLRKLLLDLNSRFPDAIIMGHRDFPDVHKACPCFDALREYAWISQSYTPKPDNDKWF
jgi:N-acetyl-anhydromuramyl-L-alanine amidase AmpD